MDFLRGGFNSINFNGSDNVTRGKIKMKALNTDVCTFIETVVVIIFIILICVLYWPYYIN